MDLPFEFTLARDPLFNDEQLASRFVVEDEWIGGLDDWQLDQAEIIEPTVNNPSFVFGGVRWITVSPTYGFCHAPKDSPIGEVRVVIVWFDREAGVMRVLHWGEIEADKEGRPTEFRTDYESQIWPRGLESRVE